MARDGIARAAGKRFKASCAAIALIVIGLLRPAIAFAQDSAPAFSGKGFQENRDYFSAGPTEHIDTLTGNVILTYTDLVLPGNAGHDLRFQRTFNAKDGRWIFAVAGLPRLSEGSNPEFPPSFFDASGAEHRTVVIAQDQSVTPTDRWVATSDFWKYDRYLRLLYLPDGTVVHYDALDRPEYTVDAFGNNVFVSYGLSPCPAGNTCIYQHFGDSTNVREVRQGAHRGFRSTA